GLKAPLGTGLALAGLGLALLVRAPIDGNYVVDVLPSMILLGLGAGIAFNPMIIVAMTDVEPERSGLASGLVNTSFMMGGALGLAVLASIAAARTGDSLASGAAQIAALTDGYHAAFAIAAVFADLCDYTRLTEQLGDEAAADMAVALGDIATTVARRHNGRVVKMLGDGAHLHFSGPADAVAASVELLALVRGSGLPCA